jgi:hypothetical protein
MVNDVAEYVTSKKYDERITIAAASNIYEPMRFWGALTQWRACTDKSNSCSGVKNLPEQGWKQLWDTLNRDPKTVQNLPVLTDIRWNY